MQLTRAGQRAVPLMVATGLLLAGCSGGDGDTKAPAGSSSLGAAGSACGDLPSALRGARLPSGLQVPTGAVLFQVGKLGGGQAYLLRRAGEADRRATVRDEAAAALTRAGYRVSGAQEGPGAAASVAFTGRQSGTLTVTPLCQGQLSLRYVVAAAKPAPSPTASAG